MNESDEQKTAGSDFSPQPRRGEAQGRAEQHIAAGVQHHLAGQLALAEAEYQAALAVDPDSAAAHNNLGFILGQSQQWQAARRHLEQALQLQPDMAMAHSNLGQVMVAMGDTLDGLAHLQQAATLAPDNLQVWENLGRVRLQLRDASGAEAAYLQACRIAPDTAHPFTQLGTTLTAQGRHDEAVAAHQRATTLAPKDADAWGQFGVSLFLRKDLGSARKVLERALALKADHPVALRHLALVQVACGETDAAIATLEQLLQAQPAADESRVDLAVMLLSRGRVTDAHALTRALHDQHPTDERIAFYHAQALAGIGFAEAAGELLGHLAEADSEYGRRARQLLGKTH